MPLRVILTGKEKGPELKNLLPLLDKETLLRKFGKI
jgi:glutamyl/glutaminyl-tRNA synthetase